MAKRGSWRRVDRSCWLDRKTMRLSATEALTLLQVWAIALDEGEATFDGDEPRDVLVPVRVLADVVAELPRGVAPEDAEAALEALWDAGLIEHVDGRDDLACIPNLAAYNSKRIRERANTRKRRAAPRDVARRRHTSGEEQEQEQEQEEGQKGPAAPPPPKAGRRKPSPKRPGITAAAQAVYERYRARHRAATPGWAEPARQSMYRHLRAIDELLERGVTPEAIDEVDAWICAQRPGAGTGTDYLRRRAVTPLGLRDAFQEAVEAMAQAAGRTNGAPPRPGTSEDMADKAARIDRITREALGDGGAGDA